VVVFLSSLGRVGDMLSSAKTQVQVLLLGSPLAQAHWPYNQVRDPGSFF